MRLKITNGMNNERKKVSEIKVSKVMLHNRLNEVMKMVSLLQSEVATQSNSKTHASKIMIGQKILDWSVEN